MNGLTLLQAPQCQGNPAEVSSPRGDSPEETAVQLICCSARGLIRCCARRLLLPPAHPPAAAAAQTLAFPRGGRSKRQKICEFRGFLKA